MSPSSARSSMPQPAGDPIRIGTLVIPTDPYWIQVAEAIARTNQKLGDELVVLQPAGTLEELYHFSTDELADQILAHDLDALICTLASVPLLRFLVDQGLPVICLGELYEFSHPLFVPIANLYDGARIAGAYIAEKLLGKGHAVCISAGLERLPVTGQGRLSGFMDALQPFPGLSTGHIPAYWSYTLAYPVLYEALKIYPRPIDAIFGASDTLILAARDAASKLGLLTPETVLVGLNGDPMALVAVEEGSLAATVDTSGERVGEEAMILAHQAALGGPLPPFVQQHYQLITKENVASVAVRKLAAIAEIPTHMVGSSRQQERDRLSQLEVTTEVTRQIGELLDHKHLAEVISKLVHENYGYDWMRILRWSEADQRLTDYAGNLSPASAQISIDQDALLQQVFCTHEPVVIPDIHNSRRVKMSREWQPVRSRAVLPIQLGAKVIGVLDLQSSQPVRKPSLETVGLKLLASQLGVAIRNADLYLDALQAREVAERANQLKTRFLANVGHEMRTPLNAILGFSQAIQKQLTRGAGLELDVLERDIQHIYKSGEHLMYVINDLLDVSRAEIGALNLYFEMLQPVPFLKELFQTFTLSDESAPQVSWVLDIPEDLPLIRADIIRLRQIIINLLTNARKHTQSGTITLGTEVDLPYLHFWVRDTGSGVPVEYQEKIFEPFGTASRKRRAEGIGLGLNITRHLVTLHNGVITLESQPGQGSTFHVYLPLPGLTQEPQGKVTAGAQPLMLVVTLGSAIPQAVLQICAAQGLKPRLVTARDHLSDLFAEGEPAAVAIDLGASSAANWSLIYRLFASQKCAPLPVVVFGEGGSPDQPTGLTNILFKPCSGNTLKDWIEQLDCGANAERPVLIVDDDPEARAYYRRLVEEAYPQMSILTAKDGREALEILSSEIPSLVLLDLMMPEVDGFAVLEQIRAQARTQRVPVVIISGKLLNIEDIQRLNYARTTFTSKGLLADEEIIQFLHSVGGETPGLPQPTSLLIKQALAYIHMNYQNPITRKDLACAVGVSQNYLSEIFRQEVSLSPWDYLTRFRVYKSQELLKQTQESVTRIATLVGYNDSAYFSRVFHKLTGQSPLEYRQSNH